MKITTNIAQIVKAPKTDQKCFSTTTKNTGSSQRETLEEIIINLATLADAKEIHIRQSTRGGFFYEVQAPGFSGFQSASNTILELSRKLSHRA